MIKIIPAILTSDENELISQIKKAEHVSDLVQIDVIDGKFANNNTIGISEIEGIQTTSRLEIQLMTINPSYYIEKLARLNFVSRIIFPIETNEDILENIYNIKKFDKQVGISLNLETPIGVSFEYFNQVDFLVLMGVKIGFSGQKFSDKIYEKIKQTKKLDASIAIEVDGGISEKVLSELSKLDVDFAAVNSALFGANDFYLEFQKLQKLIA